MPRSKAETKRRGPGRPPKHDAKRRGRPAKHVKLLTPEQRAMVRENITDLKYDRKGCLADVRDLDREMKDIGKEKDAVMKDIVKIDNKITKLQEKLKR